MRPTLQKYLTMRYPPMGSKGQVSMPTSAATGANFPQGQPQPAAPVAQATPRYAPPVVGNLVLPWRTMFFAVAFFCGAALLLVAILDGDVRLFQSQVPTAAAPVVVVITATPMPTLTQPTPQPVIVERIIIVTTTPPVVYVQPARPAQSAQRQTVRNLPAPTVQAQAAWPAPPTGTANGRMGYQCADGRYFPADDGRWGMFGFGQWIADGTGDVIDIRDTADAGDGKLGWHYNCKRVWR